MNEPIDLKKKFTDLLTLMSYYNAAEGWNWNRETEKRDTCSLKLRELARVLDAQGIDTESIVRTGGYLVTREDWRDPLTDRQGTPKTLEDAIGRGIMVAPVGSSKLLASAIFDHVKNYLAQCVGVAQLGSKSEGESARLEMLWKSMIRKS